MAAIVFWRMLPPARHFTPRSLQPRALAADLHAIAADPGLPKLFGIGFLVLGIVVGAYNYLGCRLSQAPYGLGPGAIGAIFALYAIGYGEDVNEVLLRQVASGTSRYFFAPGGEELTRIYRTVGGQVVCR